LFLSTWQTKFHTNINNRQVTVLYILLSVSKIAKRQNKRFWTEWYREFCEFNALLISSWTQF
jgi:hypothetical protein